MAEHWPSFLDPKRIMFRIRPMVSIGVPTFSGKRQKVAPDVGYWVASLTGFPIVTDDQILEWRGIVADQQGGLGDIIIGPFDERRAPTFGGLPPVIEGIPHSDGALFSDHSGYRQSTILVRLTEDLDLRATSATLTIEQAGEIKRGMYFSIIDEAATPPAPRFYMVTGHPIYTGEDQVAIRFLPTLRAPVLAGAEVDFGDPKCLMNFATPDVGALELELSRYGYGSLELEESWNGL